MAELIQDSHNYKNLNLGQLQQFHVYLHQLYQLIYHQIQNLYAIDTLIILNYNPLILIGFYLYSIHVRFVLECLRMFDIF
jgi:hypothetical protein